MHVRGQNNQILQIFASTEKHNISNVVSNNPNEPDASQSFLFDQVFEDTQHNLDVFGVVM